MSDALLYYAEDMQEVEVFFSEAEKPLEEDSLEMMREVQQERTEEEGEDWYICLLECTICTNKMTSIVPACNKLEGFECSACGEMSCEIKEDIDYGNEYSNTECQDMEEE